MKNFFKKSIIIALSIAIIPLINFSAKAESPTVNRFNVVFVIDTSLSMKDTDKSSNRFEATALFLAMLADEGNNVGLVSFSDKIESKNIQPISGNQDKIELSNNIRKRKPSGDTDIGGALAEATDMLTKMDSDLPSIIILLSDGNTDLDTEKLEEKSKKTQEDAIEKARDNKIKIYTVILNADGEADIKELKTIAKATNGKFEEVKSATDLSKVFEKFYSEIYGTKSYILHNAGLRDNGKGKGKGELDLTITVSDYGVEELNIAVFGNVDGYTLTSPSGEKKDKKGLSDNIFSSKTFDLIKILNPELGDWHIKVTGDIGTNVKVVKTYNSNLNMKVKPFSESDFKVKKPIPISVKLYEGDKAIDDISAYQKYKPIITVKYKDEVIDKIQPSKFDESYLFKFTPQNIGTYYLNVAIDNDDVSLALDLSPIEVGNTNPEVVVDNPNEIHFTLWPFIKNDTSIDLNGFAKDVEDTELNYIIVSSSWSEDEDYTFDSDLNTITMESFKNLSKGSFEIKAYDSDGGKSPSIIVKVTSTNVGKLATIILIAALAVVLSTFGGYEYYQHGRAFMGKVRVEDLNNPNHYGICETDKGRVDLNSSGINNTEFRKKSYFQGRGKEDYIFFKSHNKIYLDNNSEPIKKIKLYANDSVNLYSAENKLTGVRVTFIPLNQENYNY